MVKSKIEISKEDYLKIRDSKEEQFKYACKLAERVGLYPQGYGIYSVSISQEIDMNNEKEFYYIEWEHYKSCD